MARDIVAEPQAAQWTRTLARETAAIGGLVMGTVVVHRGMNGVIAMALQGAQCV